MKPPFRPQLRSATFGRPLLQTICLAAFKEDHLPYTHLDHRRLPVTMEAPHGSFVSGAWDTWPTTPFWRAGMDLAFPFFDTSTTLLAQRLFSYERERLVG